MRSCIVYIWTTGNNSKWIDGRVASIVMLLDMLHMDSATHSRDLIYVFSIVEQIWVLAKELLVALEVNSINLYFQHKFMVRLVLQTVIADLQLSGVALDHLQPMTPK